MSEETQNTTAPQKRGWSRALLAVSLTLNLLVVGLVVGANVGGHADKGFNPRGPERGAIRELGFGPWAGALERDDRRAIGRELKSRSGSYNDSRAKLEGELTSILNVLRADEFKPDALASVFEAQSGRLRERGETMRELVVERIAKMSQEERLAFADRIENSIKNRSHTNR